MHIILVKRRSDGHLIFTSTGGGVMANFCREKRSESNSKCEAYYSQLFNGPQEGARKYSNCPYGFQSLGPINWTENPRVASGFLLSDLDGPQPTTTLAFKPEVTSKSDVESFLSMFDSVASEYYQHSYDYLESAIHDVRHLNSAISTHAERLLKQLGYDMGHDWDLAELNKSDNAKKALSVFCASRDISAALSLHEIAIDPKRAQDELIPQHLHKLFYRQWQISSDKIIDKNLYVQMGNTTRVLQLTKSFSLIPMILLNNAIKYSQSNSHIKIDFVEASSIFRIVCTNFGPIIREDELPRVFEKNWRGSNRSGVAGHGIGLWLASLIVGANLGKIEMSIAEKGRDLAGRRIGETKVTVRLIATNSQS